MSVEMQADIAALKEQVKSSHKRLDILEENAKVIPKMETLLELSIDTNKKQTDTLNNINNNLTMLNTNYDNLTHRVGTIEDDIKISGKSSTININKLATDIIYKVIPGIALIWLTVKFGLK